MDEHNDTELFGSRLLADGSGDTDDGEETGDEEDDEVDDIRGKSSFTV